MRSGCLMDKYSMYINGKWIGRGLEELVVHNPANGDRVGSVPFGGEAETTEAIDAAHEAFQTWSKQTPYERAGYLKKLNELIIDHVEELAQLMKIELGKPINERSEERRVGKE